FNPLISGITGMEFKKFFTVTGFACLFYVSITILSGYFIGEYFPEVKKHIGFIIPAIIIFMMLPMIRSAYHRN
ncbi:MAG TPA: hypothetical protein VNW99_08375, partial [Cytophagaceae bacterium]|nr:hypothetical protein [Cytophagaceae bacterium]